MTETITFLIGFILGYGIASLLLSKKRFLISTNEKGETTIEQIGKPKHKMEFIGEPTQQELEEMEKPRGLHKFMQGFVKPAKKEEEEEEA